MLTAEIWEAMKYLNSLLKVWATSTANGADRHTKLTGQSNITVFPSFSENNMLLFLSLQACVALHLSLNATQHASQVENPLLQIEFTD